MQRLSDLFYECRLVALQTGGAASVYDAVECITTAVPDRSPQCTGAILDVCDPTTFLLTHSDGELHIQSYKARSTRGPRIVRLASQAGGNDEEVAKRHMQEGDMRTVRTLQRQAGSSMAAHGQRAGSGAPLLCRNGALTWCSKDGQLRHSVLCTHTALQVCSGAALKPAASAFHKQASRQAYSCLIWQPVV